MKHNVTRLVPPVKIQPLAEFTLTLTREEAIILGSLFGSLHGKHCPAQTLTEKIYWAISGEIGKEEPGSSFPSMPEFKESEASMIAANLKLQFN